MSKTIRKELAQEASQKIGTHIMNALVRIAHQQHFIISDEMIGANIGAALDKYAEHVRVEALREATKQICMYCESPEEHRCLVATLQQGEWVHHLPQPGLKDWCKAATIHNLIIQTTKVKDGGG